MATVVAMVRRAIADHDLGDVVGTIHVRRDAGSFGDVLVALRPRAARRAGGAERVARAVTSLGVVAEVRHSPAAVAVRLTDTWVARAGDALEAGHVHDDARAAGSSLPAHLVGFLGANTCKALHVGHLRNVVLGHAIASALAAAGVRTTPYSLVGDIGRNVAEAMAGYLDRYGGTPPAAYGKADHVVGRCYSEYLATRNGAGPDGDDPCAREAEFAADAADGLLDRWRAGSGPVHEWWTELRAAVERGHDETLAGLGIRVARRWHESVELERACRLVALAEQRGLARRVGDGRVVHETGLAGFPTLVLSRSDGFPTEHARVLAVFDRIYRDSPKPLVHLDLNGTEWIAALAAIKSLMRSLDLIPDHVDDRPLFHGMVYVGGAALSSSDGDPLLVDDLLARLAAHPGVAGHAGLEPHAAAAFVVKAFLLAVPVARPVHFGLEQLLDPERNPAWPLLRAWHGTAHPPSGGADPPSYRLAVLRAHTFPGALLETVSTYDPKHVLAFARNVADDYLSAAPDPALTRVTRTTLGAALAALGLLDSSAAERSASSVPDASSHAIAAT